MKKKSNSQVIFLLLVILLIPIISFSDIKEKYHSKSQFGQDRWILEYLGFPENGYYVDIGAADGVSGSNTYGLDKHLHWNGLCIDPFYRNSKNRTCIAIKEVVSDYDGETVEFVVAGDLSGVKETIDEWWPRVKNNKRVKFKTKSLKTIFAANNVPACINYVNLDIEGGEYKALSTFPFNQYCFQTITLEHNTFNKNPIAIKKRAKISKLLTQHGYKLIKEHRVDDFYAHHNNCAHVCKTLATD